MPTSKIYGLLLPILLLCLGGTAHAQTTCDTTLAGKTITDIMVIGNNKTRASTILREMAHQKGDTLIIAELEASFRVHEKMGTYLGGVHLELTGENVTECTGGARGLTDADLARAYKSTVDPRLNYEQAMEVAMRIAGL